MLTLGTLYSNWAMPDYPIKNLLDKNLLKKGIHPVQDIAKRLRANGIINSKTVITTFWINGTDALLDSDFFRTFAECADNDKQNNLRIILVKRLGKNLWSKSIISKEVPKLEKYILRCHSNFKNPTSGTKIRQAITINSRIQLRKAQEISLVEAYMLGLMHNDCNRKI